MKNGKSGVSIVANNFSFGEFELISGNSIFANGGLGIQAGGTSGVAGNPYLDNSCFGYAPGSVPGNPNASQGASDATPASSGSSVPRQVRATVNSSSTRQAMVARKISTVSGR